MSAAEKPSVTDVIPVAMNVTPEKRHGLIRNYPMTYSEAYYPPKPQKVYHIEIPKNLYPSGQDPGQAVVKDMVKSYADQLIIAQKPKQKHVNLEKLSTAFKEASFEEQLESLELDSIPLESAIAIQHFSHPHHSKDVKKFFIHFTKLLKYNDMTLVKARLSGLDITDFILDQLCSGLCRNESVQYLMLNNNKITDIGVERLCSALRWHPVIHSIWLGGNYITDIGLRHLAILCQRNHNITEFNVANKWPSPIWSKQEYDLHPHITHIGIDFVAKAIVKGTGLTSISLADQRIRDEGAMMLFEVLKDSNLRSINLSKNELTDRCCLALQDALKDNPILQNLNLSKNLIGDTGAIDIAAGAAYNENLSTLDLSHNVIDVRGLYALYKCLEYNRTLESLLTIGNKTSDDRAENLVVSRSRSVFTFGSSGTFSSSSSSSMLFPNSSSQRISLTRDNFKEVRRSLFMNPEDAKINESENNNRNNHVRRSSLVFRSDSVSTNNESPSKKRYNSFAEMIRSPFKSAKDIEGGVDHEENSINGKIDSSVEIHGKKTRIKSTWLGSSSSSANISYDEYSIQEGSHEQEHEDDQYDVALRRRVKKMVHAANKAHHGPMNIQDAIKTAVHIVEKLEEEEEEHKHEGNKDDSNLQKKRRELNGKKDDLFEDNRHSVSPHQSRETSMELPIKGLEDSSPSRPLTTTRASVLKQPQDGNADATKKKKKHVRLHVDGDIDDVNTKSRSVDDGDSASNETADRNANLSLNETDVITSKIVSIDRSEGENTNDLDKNGLIPIASSSFDPLQLPHTHGDLTGDSKTREQEKALIPNSSLRPKTGAVGGNPFSLPEEEMKKFFMEDINPRLKNQSMTNSHESLYTSTSSSSKRLSQNYGKILGVPQIKSRGIRPIRTSISSFADSGEHLMYLRVATEDDPEESRPYPLIKIALDKRAERERIKRERQSAQYKMVGVFVIPFDSFI
jgi:hypothetical protein